jgi:hypothetical protein
MTRKPRDELDRYMTPPEFAEAAVAMLDDYCDLAGRVCLEPHVGAGAFASAMLRRPIASIETIDLDMGCGWARKLERACGCALPVEPWNGLCYQGSDPYPPITHRHGDFLEFALAKRDPTVRPAPFDLACGNPPFADAELHIRAAHGLLSSRGVMGFVLPLHFLGSSGRRDFYRELMPTEVQTIRPRIPFAQEMREMGFYIWDKQAMGLGRRHFAMSWIDWEPVKKPRKPRKAAEIGTEQNGRTEEDRQETEALSGEGGEAPEGSPQGEPVGAEQALAQVIERLNEGETVICRQGPAAQEEGRHGPGREGDSAPEVPPGA